MSLIRHLKKKRKEKRPLHDIHFERPKSFLELLNPRAYLGGRIIDLKPTFYKRHQAWVLAFVVLASASFFILKNVLTRAEVADFYPKTCLGSWQNPQHAEGNPETFGQDAIPFSDDNSATYEGSSSDIYCGGFIASDFETEGEIKNVGITFVWQVGEANVPPAQETLPTDAIPQNNTETSSTASSTSFFSNKHFSFLPHLLNYAFAEELASDTITTSAGPEPTPPPTPTPLPASGAQTNTSDTPDTPPPPPIDISIPADQTTPSSNTAPLVTETSEDAPKEVTTPNEQPTASDAATTTDDISTSSMPQILQTAPDENFLKINYSTDGQTWSELARVNPSNWKSFTATLPITNWDDLKKIQIQIEGISTSLTEIPKVYLDGFFVEVHYELPPIGSVNIGITNNETQSQLQSQGVAAPQIIVLPPTQKIAPVNSQGDFSSDEAPAFDLDLENLPIPTTTEPTTNAPLPPPPMTTSSPSSTSYAASKYLAVKDFFLDFLGLHKKANAEVPPITPTESNPIIASVSNPEGKPTDLSPTFLTTNNRLRVTFPEPGSSFMPGQYHLKIWFWRNGVVYFTENDFTWGVLAVNFNKSMYMQGDVAMIGVGVLTNQGHTICDANITIEATSPSGKIKILSTTNNSIVRSPECGPQTVTNTPDYSAHITARELGTYSFKISATTNDGTRATADSFTVQNPPAFDVERLAPTRIYPPADYTVTFRITAHEDYSGTITETLPTDFSIVTPMQTSRSFSGGTQSISWLVDLRKGSSTDITYSFNAPDISPELFKLGPLQIGSWQESRNWQIASDAAGDVILMWDGTSADVPAGWTCVSCAIGDAFYGVFPRASSSYSAASSSANSFAHTETVSSSSGSSATVSRATGSGNLSVASTATHTIASFASASGDIRPPYKNLLFIKANAPASLPAGIIAMFDISSTSSLPAGWTSYDTLNVSSTNIYLRGGENTTSTGGAVNHTHAISVTTATSTSQQQGGGTTGSAVAGQNTHTHSVSGNLNTASNTPSYATIVFGKLSADGSIPSGTVAFFDNASLPTNWNQITTSSVNGASFSGNLLMGSSSAGNTGGSTTHTHATTTLTSGNESASVKISTAGAFVYASGNGTPHTHNFEFKTTATSSLPIYRDVILAKYTPPANSAPTVSNVKLNNSSAITLTANATTSISVTASSSDPDGAGDISYATGTIYRSSVSGGAACSANNLNCYQVASSSCSFTGSTSTVTCTANIYYFAQATDASSSFSADNWLGKITLTDSVANTNSSSTASGVETNTLLAIDVTPASTDYGTLSPGADTGSTNQTSSVKNAGNASTTLNLSGTALTTSTVSLATSSQHYATSSFTFGGTEQSLSDISTAVSGFLLTSPTSTNAVSSLVYWGITIANGKPQGTYTGTNTFTAVFSP